MKTSWDLEVGDEITPDLEVVEVLGGGSQNEVVLAYDRRRLDLVVVKLLRPDRRDDDGLRALRAEADLLDRVRHAIFPRLLECEDDHERPHFVMEHVEGPRLSRLVRKYGPLAYEQSLPLGVELAGALHYLHGQELVHLDIKPGNLVVSGNVRVVDLGVARTFEDAALIRRGRVGTVSWMSPEQHHPGWQRVGPWSDVWAWGAVMTWAVSGSWPFRELRKRHGGDTWVLEPQDIELIELPRRLPAAMAEPIRAALAWEPKERPTPAELAAALEPMVDELSAKRVLGRPRPRFGT